MASRRSPWWTVAAGAIGTGLGTGILINYGISVFAKPIAEEYGWSREVLAQCLSLNLFMNGLSALIMGEAISRYGVRRPTIVAVLIFGFSLSSLAFAPASPVLFHLIFAVMGLAGAGATAMPYARVICELFEKRRGLALGLAVGGGGLGATSIPHILTWGVGEFGWRQTILVLGLVAALVPSLAIAAWMNRDARIAREARRSAKTDWGELLRSRHYLAIAFAILVVSVATLGILPNVIPMMTDEGFTPEMAAAALSFAGFGSWVGRIAAGYILDKIFAPWVTIGIFLVTALGCVLFTVGGSVFVYALAAATIGLAIGAEADLATYLVSRYVDTPKLSRATASMWMLWSWGGGLGIFIAGHLFALSGNYITPFWLFAALLVIASLAISRLGPYLYVKAEEEAGNAVTPGRPEPA